MEWINDYWYIIAISLVATIFFFGYRTRGIEEEKSQDNKRQFHPHRSDHSCCH